MKRIFLFLCVALVAAFCVADFCHDANADKDSNGFLNTGNYTVTHVINGAPVQTMWVKKSNGDLEWYDINGTLLSKFHLMNGSPERYQQFHPPGLNSTLRVRGTAGAQTGTWETQNNGTPTLNGNWSG